MEVDDIRIKVGMFTFSYSRKYNNLKHLTTSGKSGAGWENPEWPVFPSCEKHPEYFENSEYRRYLEQLAIWQEAFDRTGPAKCGKENHEDCVHPEPPTEPLKPPKTITGYDGNLVWTFGNDPDNVLTYGKPVAAKYPDDTIARYSFDGDLLTAIDASNGTSRACLEIAWVGRRISGFTLTETEGAKQKTRRVLYEYYAGEEPFGNAGNLKSVTTEQLIDENWVELKTYYYRYYKPDDPKGTTHLMKMAFFPEDFQAFAETYGRSSCLDVADMAALDYSTKYYEYNDEKRVVLEHVHRNTLTVTYEYTDYAHSNDRNAPFRKTVETEPLGNVNIVITNTQGQVVLREEFPPPGVGESSIVYHFRYNTRGDRTHEYHPRSILGYTIVQDEEDNESYVLDVDVAEYEGMIELTEYDYLNTGEEYRPYVTKRSIQKGALGDEIVLEQTRYEEREAFGKKTRYPGAVTRYADEENEKPMTTLYQYTYHENSLQPSHVLTTYPAVPSSENGDGIGKTREEYRDENGRTIWIKDESGIITFNRYDSDSGRLIGKIVDAKTGPEGWAIPPNAGKNLTTNYYYDSKGRLTETIGPEMPGIGDNGGWTSCRPVHMLLYDDIRNRRLSLRGSLFSSRSRWLDPVSIEIYDEGGQVVEVIEVRRASNNETPNLAEAFPRSSYMSWKTYHYEKGKIVAVRQYHEIPDEGEGLPDTHYTETRYQYDTLHRLEEAVSASGVITKTVYDHLDNPVETWIGTSPSTMKLVDETIYDGEGSCATCSGAAAKPKLVMQHVDEENSRMVEYGYDWRGRLTHTHYDTDTDGNSTCEVLAYDNLDRVVKSEYYLLAEQDERLLSRAEFDHDARNRTWKTARSVVDPDSGTVRGTIVTRAWYDNAGRVVREETDGANFARENEYDSIGRTVRTKIVSENNVLEEVEYAYDTEGKVTQTVFHETGPGPGMSRSRCLRTSHDVLGRQIVQADYGFIENAIPDDWGSSNVISATRTFYDGNTSRPHAIIDPMGRKRVFEYDHMGRLVKTVANIVENDNGSDANLTVDYAYNNADQLESMTVANAATGEQVTRYEYDDFGRLAAEFFPDTNMVSDKVRYEYNLAGELVRKTDQNGTAHQYEYDDLGRLVVDRVVTFGNSGYIDGTVRRIAVAYDPSGRVATITSRGAYDAVVNQILYEYDENGLLAKEYTAHDGAVDKAVTPYVGYEYDTIENLLRLKAQVYPGGKRVEYMYDNIGRVTAIKEDGDIVVEYVDRGFATTNSVSYPQPGLTLDCSPRTLNRAGRIAAHFWKNSQDTPVVDIRHNYDKVGNRLTRYDMVHTEGTEYYTYDRLDQLKTLQRGMDNEAWNYDPTGNWLAYTKNGVTQNRSHNAANEIGGDVEYDRAGNLAWPPGQPTCRYDAWNRLTGYGNNIRYEYDGLNRRIQKTVGKGTVNQIPVREVTRSFFNANWQELESRTGDDVTAYVWGLRYVDDLVSREKGEEKLYVLQDANWNVVALCDIDGMVLERYTYDGFGKRNTLMNSGIDFDRGFTGQVLDAETGLMLYRNRYYSTSLGRFLTRDPIGYDAGDPNLYRYVFNFSISRTDPSGTDTIHLNHPDPMDQPVFRSPPDPFLFLPRLEMPEPTLELLPYLARATLAPKLHCGISSCLKKCDEYPNHNERERCKAHCVLVDKKFRQWYNKNRDIGWTSNLTPCPCTIEKEGNGEWKDQCGFSKPDTTPIYWEYHHGADLCTRGESNTHGHASQCCYVLSEDGKSGKLITSGSGQGSADKGKAGFPGSILWGAHRQTDMLPADRAWFLDGDAWGCYSEAYMNLRPLIYKDCEDTPTPPLKK